jgi:hypothetical protein
MRPKDALWAFTVVTVAALAALWLRGFADTAAAVSLGVAVFGLCLDIGYLMTRRPTRVLAHRRFLDRHVRGQLAVFLAAAAVMFVVGNGDPLAHVSPILEALILGAVVATTAIYVSSLVDWYWVLPRVGGMQRSGLIPCVNSGGERWSGVTSIWLFHRAVATALVTTVLAAVPGYLAGRTGTGGTESAAWVVFGSALAIGYGSVSANVPAAFRQAFNPDIHVGDLVRLRTAVEDNHLSDAYVADVSTQGVKCKPIADADPAAPRFVDKGNLVPLAEVKEIRPNAHGSSPCPGVDRCAAANWYCFRNVNANNVINSSSDAPAPFDAAADAAF